MVPLVPDLIRDFSHLSVFIGAARLDPLIPSGQAEELAVLLKSGGADVSISWHQGGRTARGGRHSGRQTLARSRKHSTKSRRLSLSRDAAHASETTRKNL